MSEAIEKEIRTDEKGMLMCKAVLNDKGEYNLVKREGKKEDTMSVSSFLTQVYGKPVTIMVG